MERVAGGFLHSLTIDAEGYVWSFGDDSHGQLGHREYHTNFQKVDGRIPRKIQSLCQIVSVACGKYHSLCLDSKGDVFSFGNNDFGQLGLGTTEKSTKPKQISNSVPFSSVHCGEFHGICIDINSDIWTFGRNYHGELGLGNTEHACTPQKIPVLHGINASCGNGHSLILNSNGDVFGAGLNVSGQLGIGEMKSESFVKIPSLSGIINISCGAYHSVFLDQFRNVWGSGLNIEGQLGIPENPLCRKPTVISSLSGITFIRCKDYSTLFIDENRILWGTGKNSQSELGIPEISQNQKIPVQLPIETNVESISSGSHHTFVNTVSSVFVLGPSSTTLIGTEPAPEKRKFSKLRNCSSIVGSSNEIQKQYEHIFSKALFKAKSARNIPNG